MRENSSRNQDGLKYQKLYNWGRTLIMSGVLRNMDKFPSEHMLQNKFGYSRQTVRNAAMRWYSFLRVPRVSTFQIVRCVF